MARKTKSDIRKTFPVREENGDETFYVGKEAHSVTPLTDDLKAPLAFDVVTYLVQQMGASEHPISLLEFEANVRSEINTRLTERWKALAPVYKMTGDTREDWRQLALNLARDYIPGLSVEYITPVERAPRVMHREHIEALVTHVGKVLAGMRAGRSKHSAKISESSALKAVWKNWPTDLGRKRSTFKSFEAHYYQCKAAYAPSLATLSLADLATKR